MRVLIVAADLTSLVTTSAVESRATHQLRTRAAMSLIPWPDASAIACPPRSCPFAHSQTLVGLDYLSTGSVSVPDANVDTWYPSWSASGDLYSTWTDGAPDGKPPATAAAYASSCGPCQRPPNNGSSVEQGFARAVGATPETLRIASAASYVSISER